MKSWQSSTSFTASTLVALPLLFPLQLFAEEGITGVWKGAILNKTGTSDYNLILSFSGSSGKPSGKTQYVDLGCKGELKLKSSKQNTYTFIETMTQGSDRCASGSTIEITTGPNGKLSYKWLYPNGKPGILADLVKDGGAAPVTAVASTKAAPRQQSSTSTQEDEATEAGNKALALRYLEDSAAHPGDPQNPRGVEGVSDENIANMDFEDVKNLFALTLSYAEKEVTQPRYLFALGRAAYLHDDEDSAKKLLKKAESRGSAAASAYIAKMMNDSDLPGMATQFRKAVNGGFEPAKPWLAETESLIAEQKEARRRAEAPRQTEAPRQSAAPRQTAFDFSRFNRPDLIKGFYTNDLSNISTTPLQTLAYVSSIQEFLMDHTAVLFITEDRMILSEPDPNLSTIIGRKFTSNSQVFNEGMSSGIQSSPFAMLLSMMQARKSGASVGEEVQAGMQAAANNPMTEIQMIKNQATQDARILVLFYESNPEAFRKVYSGIKKYVYGL